MSDTSIVRLPMPIPAAPALLAGSSLLKKLWHSLWLIVAHLEFSMRPLRGSRLIIREFLTIPLLLASPWLFTRRRSLWFLIAHNLQTASTRLSERLALKFLARLGFRFLVFEDHSVWSKALNNATGPVTLNSILHPVAPSDSMARPAGVRARVGSIGNFRPEKNMQTTLEQLVQGRDDGRLDAELVLGCPEEEHRKAWQSLVEVIDTTSAAVYSSVLNSCSVLVISYSRDAYFYRASGVIADAVSAGVRIVCPNFPLLHHQVNYPLPVGVCYDDDKDIVRAVLAALQIDDDTYRIAREAHLLRRGVAGLGSAMRELE